GAGGLDAGAIAEASARRPAGAGAAPGVPTGAAKDPVDPPAIRSGPPPKSDDAPPPLPVIRTGPRPEDGPEKLRSPKEDVQLPTIRSGNRMEPGKTVLIPPASTEEPPVAPPVKVAGGEEPSTDSVPMDKKAKPPVVKVPGDIAAPPLPPVPSVNDDITNTIKPPIGIELTPPAKTDKVTDKDPVAKPLVGADAPPPDRGDELLKLARAEHMKGDTEAARKIVIELLSGPYSCKEEAAALLKSIETTDHERKMTTARKAFENGLEAYHTHNYAQALAIFKQIDGTLLSSPERKSLAEMITTATAKQKEMQDATAVRNGAKLPTAPKVVPGVPDLPGVGPAPTTKAGPDSLLKQQEALAQVEFQ